MFLIRISYELASLRNKIIILIFDYFQPLYEQLHAFVRQRLHEKYGNALVDPEGPIPAHLLGNMWAQSWNNIADMLKHHSEIRL